ncbi:hypothetical protein [Tenacibaculum finnmarkense]|uniref:hypothetical protein n=1 Tax=Tenacibaculum finnmarkense TaxID=2781243 RepID=UPI001EFB3A5E|nr:hypothetical protein [Tenacibaculum finnmarkense]MCG8253247.1 hypothetical protein [Tenacibaculum finnmarkense genomovar finnmarkense]MCG8816710.1 hypothetical protein [Tenacibaculum finnmarkense]MCG8821707.1 hypothetical protein [Tenacibaculum finnmarkense]
MYVNNTYFNSLVNIQKGINGVFAICESRLQNKTILPIENYDIQYYANGKIVALWQKNLNPILYTKGEFINSEGKLTYFEGGQVVFLYKKKDSKYLDIWSF